MKSVHKIRLTFFWRNLFKHIFMPPNPPREFHHLFPQLSPMPNHGRRRTSSAAAASSFARRVLATRRSASKASRNSRVATACGGVPKIKPTPTPNADMIMPNYECKIPVKNCRTEGIKLIFNFLVYFPEQENS